MTRFIAVMSGKGGVGKTTTTINLGTALNSLGRDVTIVDANLTTPNLGLHLGSTTVPVTIHHALQGKNHITEAIYKHESGTKIIPGSISIDDLRSTNPGNLKNALHGLNGTTELVLVDGPPGLTREALLALESVNEILIVTNADIPSLTDALKTIRLAEEMGKKVLGVVVSRVKNDNLDLSIKNIETLLEKKVISLIPEDKAIRKALRLRDSVIFTDPKSIASRAYKKLAHDLIGQKYEEDVEKEKQGFFIKLLRFLGF
jgi:septum site-determining protein MinD